MIKRMGPGFFIFFSKIRNVGRGKFFPAGALEWRATRKLKRKLRYYREQEVDEILSQNVIEQTTEDMVSDFTAPVQQAYNIDSAEAESRLREFIQDYIQKIQDEEIALLIILASI